MNTAALLKTHEDGDNLKEDAEENLKKILKSS